MKKYVLSLDQGTTSSRAVVFDESGKIAGMAQKEFTQHYPNPGWVEHDAIEILDTQLYAMKQALLVAGVSDIEAIGITNQRETVVAWNSDTGKPICGAVVWQCRRTAEICEELKTKGLTDYIKETTGLVPDPYFSGTKMKWIMDNVPEAKELAKENKLRFGTVDTWLIYNLSGKKDYITDYSNASRTMLFNIHNLNWDDKMLTVLGIPKSALPTVVSSSGVFSYCDENVLGKKVPISGIAGDQHAALFGQCCFEKGMTKNTYGTGCFTLMNTADKPVMSEKGLLTTIAWNLDGKTTYALEGSAFNAGSAIQWLRDELKIIESAPEADMLAESIDSNDGVYFVPAFTGLGAPYWDMYARGTLLGLTRGTGRAQIARAVLESIAYESCDLITAMEEEAKAKIPVLRVDGGASRSRFLMQYQSDMLGAEVQRPECLETTALGAAFLAGLAVGVWKDLKELEKIWTLNASFKPEGNEEQVKTSMNYWKKAVNAARGWLE